MAPHSTGAAAPTAKSTSVPTIRLARAAPRKERPRRLPHDHQGDDRVQIRHRQKNQASRNSWNLVQQEFDREQQKRHHGDAGRNHGKRRTLSRLCNTTSSTSSAANVSVHRIWPAEKSKLKCIGTLSGNCFPAAAGAQALFQSKRDSRRSRALP